MRWPGKPAKPKPENPHPVRSNIEAIAVAIALVLILKYFSLEIYQIPTPSMQPALMGSVATGVHDRVVVDKLRYTFAEPQRYDIAVFRYPLRTNQNYVKRIVGMPGEALRIIGGNVYRRTSETPEVFEAVRKPDDLMQRCWKLLYDSEASSLGGEGIDPRTDFTLTATRGEHACRERQISFTLQKDGRGTARFNNSTGRSDRLRNHYWHGYPAALHEAMLQKEVPPGSGSEPVADLRIGFDVTLSGTITAVTASLYLRGGGSSQREFVAEWTRDGGALYLSENRGSRQQVQSFSRGFGAADGVRLELAHADDQVVVTVAGTEVARHAYVPSSPGIGDSPMLAVGVNGEGRAVIESIRIERDLHYIASGIAEAGATVLVPEGHYWMLGDNTMASEDGRAWQTLAFRVDPDGRIHSDGSGGVELTGNRRPRPTTGPVDADENPVVAKLAKAVVFNDSLGEPHVFPWDGKEWMPLDGSPDRDGVVATPSPFVPRRYFIGRAIFVFWPFWPFHVNRIGFVR